MSKYFTFVEKVDFALTELDKTYPRRMLVLKNKLRKKRVLNGLLPDSSVKNLFAFRIKIIILNCLC